MAVIKGTAGKIKVGSAVIAEVRSFSVNERVNTVETTTLGSTAESHATTYTSFSGTIDAFFDDTDTSENRKQRTKNLFYVSCSRAKENLVVLALSQMGDLAMNKITEWFGVENINTI